MRGRSARAGSGRWRRRRSAGSCPAPRPWTKRAATRTSIDGARPPTSRPIANRPRPAANGHRQPAPVDRAADHDDADERAEEERREDPAVQLEPAELVRDDRHDRRDRERLEADQRDRQDEAERSGRADRRARGCPSGSRAGRFTPKGWRGSPRPATAVRRGSSVDVRPRSCAAAFDHRPARRSTIGASSSTSPSMTELIPSRSRSPTSFSTRPSIEPMNRCGDSRTSSEVSSTPVPPAQVSR